MRNTHKALKSLLRALWWVLWVLRLARRRRYRQRRQQQRSDRRRRCRRCRRCRAVRFGLRFQTKRQRRSAAADRQRTARGQRGWCPGNPQPTAVADCGPHRVHTQTQSQAQTCQADHEGDVQLTAVSFCPITVNLFNLRLRKQQKHCTWLLLSCVLLYSPYTQRVR